MRFLNYATSCRTNAYGYANVSNVSALQSFDDLTTGYASQISGGIDDVMDEIGEPLSAYSGGTLFGGGLITRPGGGGGTIPLDPIIWDPSSFPIEEQPLVIAVDPDDLSGGSTVIYKMPSELIVVYGNGNTTVNQTTVITKSFVLDYTSPLAEL